VTDEGDHIPARSASVRPEGRVPSGRWSFVSLPGPGVRVPECCACCGKPANAAASALRASDGLELSIGYCTACLAHAGRDGTRTLAVALASLLLGLTFSVAWPLFALASSVAVHAAVVVLMALAPIVVAALVRPRAAEGHAAWGGAVAWSSRELGCARRDYAEALLRSNDGARLQEERRSPWFSPWMTAGPLLGLLASLFVHGLYYPSLRVLNLSGEPLVLWIDGERQTPVEPSSVESPAAGRELRVSAGPHRLEARRETGEVLSRVEVVLDGGKAHLYAPASSGYCFWLERRSYGRAPRQSARIPLAAENFFWVLPEGLDTWFRPLPAPTAAEQALSGGEMTALRQARCEGVRDSEPD
jgi:hypothetical protein